MVEFDTRGLRSNVEIDVMSLETKGLRKVGIYKPTGLVFLPPVEDPTDVNEYRPINEMTFKVLVGLVNIDSVDCL